jgi:outer membrane protein assembly factor BamB
MPSEPSLLPRLALLHPAFWVSLLTLLLNDHVLKHAGLLPSVVTGKLSDFAGLFVAPVLLAALLDVRTHRAWLYCHAAVGTVFVLVNLVPGAASSLGQALSAVGIPSRLWCDPSDLVALPALWASHRVFGATAERGSELHGLWRETVVRGGLALGLLGCVATSRMPPPSIPGDADHAYVALPGEAEIAVIEASTGRELRRFEHTLYAFPQPVVIDGVLVGFGEVAGQDRLMGIDVATGVLRYALVVRGSSSSLPLLSAGPLVLAVRPSETSAGVHELAAYEARSGELRWSRPVADLADLRMHLGDGVLLVAREGAVERIDPSSGARRWELELDDEVVAMASLAGRAFVQLDDDTLLALDAETGRLLTKRSLDARTVKPWTRPEGSLTASDSALFVLADGGGAYVLDAELRQLTSVPGVLGLSARGPHVLASFADSGIARLEPSTGAVLWKVESGVASDGPSLQGDLVLSGGDDEVVALDLATGKPRWRWAYPHAR